MHDVARGPGRQRRRVRLSLYYNREAISRFRTVLLTLVRPMYLANRRTIETEIPRSNNRPDQRMVSDTTMRITTAR